MKKKKILSLFLLLFCTCAFADTSIWTHVWDTSRANGGEGFYHMTANDDTIQTTIIKELNWTYKSNSSVTMYTASSGQVLGTTKSPVIHATLSTNDLVGKVKKVSVEANVKSADQIATIGVRVNKSSYNIEGSDAATLVADKSVYSFVPTDKEEAGLIEIIIDQNSEVKGSINFFSLTIEYDKVNVVLLKEPKISFDKEEITIEVGEYGFNKLINPNNLSPIKYKSGDTEIAIADNKGNVYAMGKSGETTITASFDGDDDYKPGTATYTIKVVEKPAIPTPSVNIPEGTYTEPKVIKISSDYALCEEIWYSTTAKDSADLVNNHLTASGKETSIMIDDDCTLLCCVFGNNHVGNVLVHNYKFNMPLKASFTADEINNLYYKMGWDSKDEASTWKYYGINESKSWTLTPEPTIPSMKVFTEYDENSVYTLSIQHSKDEQKERAVSPEIEILPNSMVEFYACFNGVWVTKANWKLKITDLTTNSEDILINGLLWSQHNQFEGPDWVKFNIDLQQYANHKCAFEFNYEGADGDDVCIDGFKITQINDEAEPKICIDAGSYVHFKNTSLGTPDSYEWTFEGGNITTSTEENPIVMYSTEGEYTVTLKVKRGDDEDVITKEKIVVTKVNEAVGISNHNVNNTSITYSIKGINISRASKFGIQIVRQGDKAVKRIK